MPARLPILKRVLRLEFEGIQLPSRNFCTAPLQADAIKFRIHWASKRRNGQIYCCGNNAKFKVDGEYRCRKHAAIDCLEACDPVTT